MSSEESQVSKSPKNLASSDSSIKEESEDDSSAENKFSFLRKDSEKLSSRKSIPRERNLSISTSLAADTGLDTVSVSDHFGPHFNVEVENKQYIHLMEAEEP